MAIYNTTRSFQALLAEHESSPPSFTVRLYPDYWQLNNGSKWLYNNQIASLLDDIRAQRIPVDFLELFDTAKLPFYDGCMIVEVHDYRPPKATDPTLEEPHKTRVVLSPNSETLWADICLMNQKAGNTWTDREALEVEARILVSTAPPLCLEPDPNLTRMANNVLRASVPTPPLSLKRKAAVMEQEDQETEKARRAKLAHFMNPRYTRPAAPAPRRLLEVLQQYRMMKATQAATQAAAQASQTSATTAPTASTEYGASTAPAVPAQAVASSYTQPSAPIAPAAPTAITIQPPPISAPTQPVAASVASDAAKRQGAGPGTQPPSQVPRTSGTPVQQVGHAPTAIPPHLQPHAAQTAHRTPPRTSQSPHPPPNGTPSAPTPPGPDARPPSAMQRPPSQPVHAAATPRPPSVHPVGAQPVHAQYQGAQQAVAATKVAQNNMFKKQQSQLAATVTNGVPTGTFPQGAQAGAAQGLAPMSYYQYYQYANAAQQRLNPPVQSATPVNRSPMNSSQGSTPQHSSPLAASQRLTTQSPRPSNAQQPQAQVQAQAQAHAHAPVVAAQPQPQPQPQPQVQPGQQATPNNYAYAAMQYAQFRQQTQGYVAQTPLVPHHAANGAQAGSGTNPQAAQRTAQQQYPPQSYLYYHAMQPNYWQMGRGAPVANGQVQIPNISAHTQQVVNTNKPVQGGVQGS